MGHFYALDWNGNERWSFGDEGPSWASPAIGSDGTVYFGDHESWLFAINGAPFESPPIAGTIFILIVGVILAIWAGYPKKRK